MPDQRLGAADLGLVQSAVPIIGMHPTAHCTEGEVATPLSPQPQMAAALSYPAGADTKMLAALRWSTSEPQYWEQTRGHCQSKCTLVTNEVRSRWV
jgi:hypothetical protein